jgi:SAM-dependent methyltransferase
VETVDADAFNAFEADGWEERAAGYDDAFGRLTARFAGPLLDAAGVVRGTRVLDVATGPGYAAAAAAARGASAVGIDIAEAMLALARRRAPGVDFRRASAEELPFADGSFDAVVGNLAVLHLGRPERAAAEFARVLRPGGRVALTVWDVPARSPFPGVLFDAVAAAGAAAPPDVPAGPPFFRFADADELAALLRGAGFAGETVTSLPFSHRVARVDELWDDLLRGTVRASALVARQSEEVRQEIRAALERAVEPFRTGDGLEFPVSVVLATARAG